MSGGGGSFVWRDDPGVVRAASMIRESVESGRGVMVVTGAGCSAESGIPTFRGFFGGSEASAELDEGSEDERVELPVWTRDDPMAMATPEGFARDPSVVSRWYDWRRRRCLRARANAGHVALAGLERWCVARLGGRGEFGLFTQNVDGLHQRAGSESVYELHGSLYRWRDAESGEEWAMDGAEAMDEYPPRSPVSGRWLRPGVVWFGEMLPDGVVEAGERAARGCGVLLSVGTSAVVYPAAGFAELASGCGACVVEVNVEATAQSGMVDVALRGGSALVLPALLEVVEGS